MNANVPCMLMNANIIQVLFLLLKTQRVGHRHTEQTSAPTGSVVFLNKSQRVILHATSHSWCFSVFFSNSPKPSSSVKRIKQNPLAYIWSPSDSTKVERLWFLFDASRQIFFFCFWEIWGPFSCICLHAWPLTLYIIYLPPTSSVVFLWLVVRKPYFFGSNSN